MTKQLRILLVLAVVALVAAGFTMKLNNDAIEDGLAANATGATP